MRRAIAHRPSPMVHLPSPLHLPAYSIIHSAHSNELCNVYVRGCHPPTPTHPDPRRCPGHSGTGRPQGPHGTARHSPEIPPEKLGEEAHNAQAGDKLRELGTAARACFRGPRNVSAETGGTMSKFDIRVLCACRACVRCISYCSPVRALEAWGKGRGQRTRARARGGCGCSAARAAELGARARARARARGPRGSVLTPGQEPEMLGVFAIRRWCRASGFVRGACGVCYLDPRLYFVRVD